MKKQTNYKSMLVSDVKEGNSEVLKKLFWIVPDSKPTTDIQALINNCDTRIKHPRFD